MTESTEFPEHLRTIAQLRDEMQARINQQAPEATGVPIIVKLDETKLPRRPAPAAELAAISDLIRQGRTLKLTHESCS